MPDTHEQPAPSILPLLVYCKSIKSIQQENRHNESKEKKSSNYTKCRRKRVAIAATWDKKKKTHRNTKAITKFINNHSITMNSSSPQKPHSKCESQKLKWIIWPRAKFCSLHCSCSRWYIRRTSPNAHISIVASTLSLSVSHACIRLYIYQTIRISNDSILIFCIFLVLSIRRQLLSPNIQQKHYLNNGYAMDGGRHVSTLTTASIDSFIVRDLSFNAIIHKSKVELCFQFFVRVFAFAWHPDWPPLLGPRRAAACSTECGILQINIGEAR